jgi:hypothetical protein
MSERDEIRSLCRWNRTLAQENLQLRAALRRKEQECRKLRATGADRAAELAACDRMLGAAMDRALAER